MKIFLHDYCGHPFQMQLSRWLAARGHEVCHCYSKDIESPRGNLADGNDRLTITAIAQGQPIPKYDLVRRTLQERSYAKLAGRCVDAFRPDIVISGNAPPAIQSVLQRAAHKSGGAFVYWLQDIVSAVLDRVLSQKIPIVGSAISAQFRAYEFSVMRKSDAVILISEDFEERCVRQGVPRDKLVVQHNWAPLSEISPVPRDNPWARASGVADKFVFLFSGTLGLKHNPGILSRLAEHLRAREDAVVCVVSQGMGRSWLENEATRKKLANLRFFDFQPFDQISNLFGSADVLVAILEPFAGELSVPSKILSYLCAERPLLAALPAENLASRIITWAGAGKVVSPLDEGAFMAAADALMNDSELRRSSAVAGRTYAEKTFDIDAIGGHFESLFERLAKSARPRPI